MDAEGVGDFADRLSFFEQASERVPADLPSSSPRGPKEHHVSGRLARLHRCVPRILPEDAIGMADWAIGHNLLVIGLATIFSRLVP